MGVPANVRPRVQPARPHASSGRLAILAGLVLLNAWLLLCNTIVDPDGWTSVCVVAWHALFAWQVSIVLS